METLSTPIQTHLNTSQFLLDIFSCQFATNVCLYNDCTANHLQIPFMCPVAAPCGLYGGGGCIRTHLWRVSRLSIGHVRTPMSLNCKGGRSTCGELTTLQQATEPPLYHYDAVDDFLMQPYVETHFLRFTHVYLGHTCECRKETKMKISDAENKLESIFILPSW